MDKQGIFLSLNKEPTIKTIKNEKEIKALIKCQGLDIDYIGIQGYNIIMYRDKYRADKNLAINNSMVKLKPNYAYGIKDLSGDIFLIDENKNLLQEDIIKLIK